MASTYLSRTPSGAGNRRTFTFSGWIKRGDFSSEPNQTIISAGANPGFIMSFLHSPENEQLEIQLNGGVSTLGLVTNRLFRDSSAWYHIVLTVDTTLSTANDRVKLYVNGEQETSFSTRNNPSQNFDTPVNNTVKHSIGAYAGNDGNNFDGYMAHVHLTDGYTYDASAFGETDTNGQWAPIPTPSVTYGTNGFFLKFGNSGSLGTDSSGNGNDFTKSGSGDQVPDTPDNNFATMNPLVPSNFGFAEGNLDVTCPQASEGNAFSTIALTKGKWYVEGYINSDHGNGTFGLADITASSGSRQIASITFNGNIEYAVDGTFTDTGTNWATGGIIAFAVDIDNKTYNLYYNGTALRTNESYTSDAELFAYTRDTSTNYVASFTYNFGQDSSFGGKTTAQNNSDGNGYGDFYYAPPSGYLALCTKNLASELTLPIGDGSQYFNTVLYTGTGSDLSITGVGFQPDWVWGKCRSHAQTHRLFDSSRGVLKNIISAANNAEATTANSLTSFDSDGFTLGTDDNLNDNTRTFVAWNWKANGGTTSSNTDGDITTTVQANTTSGFSILTWTGNGTPSQSLGHGLGVTPKIMINKNRDISATTWQIFGSTIFDRMQFDTGGDDGNLPCTFSSTTITLPNLTNNTEFNSSGDNFVSYVFADIEGYSKFGTYSPPASADSSFVYLGFKPAFVLVKILSQASNWVIADNKRETFNEAGKKILFPNLGNAETSYTNGIDMLSNGFKVRGTGSTSVFGANSTGITFLYMAFAEHPFVDSTGRPATAQ